MNTQPALLGVLLRKDLRLFWPFAALTAAFIALAQIPSFVQQLGVVGGLIQIAVPLSTILLILVVVHEDAVVSVKHDWLTRPIPRRTMLAAKSLFMLLVILLPAVLGAIANGLLLGRSLQESLLSGVADGLGADALMTVACVMAFAALTGAVRQAVVTFLAGIVVLGLVTLLVVRFTGLAGIAGSDGTSASIWIIARPIALLAAVAALSVLLLQYRRQRGHAAWVALGLVLAVGTAFVASMSWPRMFAVQKRLSPDPAAASSVEVGLPPGCFAARRLDSVNPSAGTTAGIPHPAFFPEELRQQAGPDAIALAVRLDVERLPAGGRLVLGQTRLSYRSAGGEVFSLGAGRMPGQWAAEPDFSAFYNYWLVSRQDYERLAADPAIAAHLDYSLSLMQPQATATFVADGRRAFHPGIGYCGADFDTATGRGVVDCYRGGHQPALLTAEPMDEAGETRSSSDPDFTPAALDFWGGRRHRIPLRAVGDTAPEVLVTAYAGRVHFSRSFDLPGVLGDTAAACPAP